MIFIKRLVILDWGSKFLCIALLILQSTLLDHMFITFDKDNPGRWVWIVADVFVVILWIAGLIITSRNAHVKQPSPPPEITGWKKRWRTLIEEVQYAYFSWIFYSLILVAKIWYMFEGFAENFVTYGYYNVTPFNVIKFQESDLYSSTSLKIILSISGPILLLLAYAHHDEIHNSKYKLMMEKLGTMASLDILDSLMIMGLLFVDNTNILLPYNLEHAVKFFTCCCYVLPALSLYILRIMGSHKVEDNNLRLVMVVNSALYLFFVNVPFLAIRCFLWSRRDVDISTFITKNVMCVFRGMLDVYNEFRQWLKSKQGGVVTEGTSTAHVSNEPGTEMTDHAAQI